MLIDYDTVVVGGVPWRIPRSQRQPDSGMGPGNGSRKRADFPGPSPILKKPRRYRHFKFGPLELKLYRFLDGKARAAKPGGPVAEQPVGSVVRYVYGLPKDLPIRPRLRVRLRRLQVAVNKKLRKGEDGREVFAPRDDYLVLANVADRRPRSPGSAGNRPVKAPARGAVLRPWQRCQSFMQECLGQGITRSKELERLCKERGHSRRSYFRARKELGLQRLRQCDAEGFYWEVVPPAGAPTSQSFDGTVRQIAGGTPGST